MNTKTEKSWLPYAIAIFGFFLSVLLWLILEQDRRSAFSIAPILESYHPDLALLLGAIISLLVATIIKITQLAQQRARTLKHMNEDLKKEIAERLHAEESKQKLEVALLQGQKLQAIGTLAGGIAHDFNNILYAITGYVEMAREDIEKDKQIYKNLGKVLDATQRGQELISRILAFSRRQHQQFNVINLKSTIEAVLALLRPTIPASVMLHFNPQDINILGNQTQLHQVLVNMINNAVDAMDGEGHIYIQMAHLSKDDPLFNKLPDKNKCYCKIDIKDTGRGMDQTTIERIFEPFYTTKEVGKGTGLGLSIVHTIIEAHEGEVEVESRLGEGTVFHILLPEYTE